MIAVLFVALGATAPCDAGEHAAPRVTFPLPRPVHGSVAGALLLQDDGTMLVGGHRFTWVHDPVPGSVPQYSADMMLWRYRPDGTRDDGFGAAGAVATDIGFDDQIGAIAMQPDGRILAGGTLRGPHVVPGTQRIAVLRFDATGMPDPGFGDGGRAEMRLDASPRAIAIQPDGRIVLATAGAGEVVLARYTADGSLDSGFGTGGLQRTPIAGGAAGATALAPQPDGKLVAGGYATIDGDDDFLLVRYDANGIPDPTFGTGGMVRTPIAGDARIEALALEPDGHLVAAGWTAVEATTTFALARYGPDGTLDRDFGTDGIVTEAFGGSSALATAVVRQPDGMLVVAGMSQEHVALARYDTRGILDPTFGTGGRYEETHRCWQTSVRALALQPDGRLVVAGTGRTDEAAFVVLQRHRPDGFLDETFAAPAEAPPCARCSAEATAAASRLVVRTHGATRFRLHLAAPMPAPARPLDPTGGLSLVVRDATGAPSVDVAIPAGRWDPATRLGWRAERGGWVFRGETQDGAISAARIVRGRRDGMLHLDLVGRGIGGGLVGPAPTAPSARVAFHAAGASSGPCLDARWPAATADHPACRLRGRGKRLVCR